MIIHSPRQLLAAIPHLIGFHPDSSLILVAFDGKEVMTLVRIDWPSNAISLPRTINDAMTKATEPSVVILAYTEAPVTLKDVVDLVQGGSEIDLLDVLWIRRGHWGSLMCEDESCCPINGHKVEDHTSTDVAFIVSGSSPFESRDEMVARLESEVLSAEEIEQRSQAQTITNEKVRQSLDGNRTETQAQKNKQLSDDAEPPASLQGIPSQSRNDIVQNVIVNLTDHDIDSWEQHAWLCEVVSDIRMRDAFLRILFDDSMLRPKVRATLITCVARASEKDIPALATVLAGCAWLDGNGALASVALNRALDVDPSYSLARLLNRAITAGVPPSVWSDSLEAVSYEECLAGAA